MPKPSPYPLTAVLQTIRAGISATTGLAAFRAAGGEVRTATWYRLHGETLASFGHELTEADKPQHRAPLAEELTRFTTIRKTGYLQSVDIAVRSRSTGEITFKPFSVSGEGLLTRQAAVASGIELYSENADDYDEQVLGGFHVGAYELVPEQ